MYDEKKSAQVFTAESVWLLEKNTVESAYFEIIRIKKRTSNHPKFELSECKEKERLKKCG